MFKCGKCHKKLKMGPVDNSLKRHGHCFLCAREYHYTLEKGLYWHPFETRWTKMKNNFDNAFKEYEEYISNIH